MEIPKKIEDTNIPVRQKFFARGIVQSVIGIVLMIIFAGGFLFWKQTSSVIQIDTAYISAAAINLGPQTAGILTEMYVDVGNNVLPNTPLARVGNETIMAQVAGVVTAVDRELGKTFNPGQTVVTMINPLDLRVVGKIDENKGLSSLFVGEPTTFTIDAFGSKVFTGVIDKISPTSDVSGVSFSLSDARPTEQFDVSVRFDASVHPEFKNGMSARITVYK